MKEENGLSILIPVFNYSIAGILTDIERLLQSINTSVEVIFLDDCSSESTYTDANLLLAKEKEWVQYACLEYNVGRAAVRNLLAKKAIYDSLLFIDVDSKLIRDDYFVKYIQLLESNDCVVGGTSYTNAPLNTGVLRYIYGKNREMKAANVRQKNIFDSVTVNNLAIKKKVYLSVGMDDNIKKYGHEDTLFGYGLEKVGAKLLHIDNPVEHIGLESDAVFLAKTEEAIENLVILVKAGKIERSRLYSVYTKMKKMGMLVLFQRCYRPVSVLIHNNLRSGKPSLILFDMFRLNFFIKCMKAIQEKDL